MEAAVARRSLSPGDQLPTVRSLADGLEVSPTTVAAAYRTLAQRGVVVGRGRAGTFVSAGPPLPSSPPLVLPPGVRDVAAGNPDPDLLPSWTRALRGAERGPVRYGERAVLPPLQDLALEHLTADRIAAHRIAVVSGALDGVERVLLAHTRPGDRIAVEDPGFSRVLDLVAALGLIAVPVSLDQDGLDPDALGTALGDGATALIVTPRAQNPTGAATTPARARLLRAVLADHPDVLVIEDDHAGPIAHPDRPYATLVRRDQERWAVVRSAAKWLGPDIRLALLAGDDRTLDRVEGRQRVGPGWVSFLLQQLVVDLWSDERTMAKVRRAAETYRSRREALIAALEEHGVGAEGTTGLNVWIPVADEDATVGGLLAEGWAVSAGERFRLRSAPGIRATTASLSTRDAPRLARTIADVLRVDRSRTALS